MAEMWQNFASGVLSADPGVAGTTLASGNMAFLPLIVAPATLRLALDPEGLTGTPEIVVVTAHAASATTCTVVRGQETAYGAGPARAHVVGTTWRMVQTRESIMALMTPPAAIIATVAATPDPGFAFINGQTIVNSQVLHPLTWARVPAAWKAAAPDLTLPDWRGRLLVMDDAAAAFTLGGVAGANSHAITQAELPAATITIDPPTLDVSINPPPTAVTGNTGVESVPHTHLQDGINTPVQYVTAGVDGPVPSDGVTQSGPPSVQHTHPAGTLAVDILPFDVTVNIGSFPSGNLGSGAAMSLVPAVGVVQFQIKLT